MQFGCDRHGVSGSGFKSGRIDGNRCGSYPRAGSLCSTRHVVQLPVISNVAGELPPGSGDFVNAAVAFDAVTDLQPEVLLAQLKSLEQRFGRAEKYQRNAPRELDLDLLLFDQQTRNTEAFTLPHPRAVDRLFVLKPAAQLLPDTIWPGMDLSISRLLSELETDEKVYALEELPPFCIVAG